MAGASLVFDLIANDRASAKFARVGSAASGAGGHMSTLGSKLRSVAKYGALAAGAAAVFAAKLGWDAVQAASDLNEEMSKSEVIFGDGAKAIDKWASGAAMSLGQSKRQALDAASTFGIIGQKAGLSGKETVDFAKKFGSLASDMASFNNTTPEEAITAIGAAMRGESEPIRKYGVLLDDATLRARALKMGLIDNIKEGLTPQQKALAASQEILKQTDKAQGDFARTSDGLANQQRILAANVDNVKAKIGQGLLPIAVELTQWMNETLIPAAQKAGDWIGKNLGPVFEWLGDTIKNKVVPFVRDLASSIGEDLPGYVDAAKGAFKDAQPFFEMVGTVFRNVVGPAIKWVARNILPMAANNLKLLGKAFGAIGNVFRFIWNNMMQPVFKFMIQSIARALDALGVMFQALGSIPGAPAWIGKTGNALRGAAKEAEALANNIKKIPKRTEVVVHTSFTSSGRSGPGGTGGDFPGSSSGSSGGSGSTGNDSGSPAGKGGRRGRMGDFSGRTSARSKSDLDGMELRVVGLDPGYRAFLVTGGTGRY